MKYLNTDWLYSFKKLSETGNFTIASSSLNITVQTLSYHIRCLENYFNITLIERGKKNNLLTFEGELFLTKTLTLLESLENTELCIKSDLNPTSSVFNIIQSTDCNFDYCLSDAIYKFYTNYSDTKIINQSVLFFELEKALSIHTTDVAISSYPISNKNFTSIKLAEMPYVIAAEKIKDNWKNLDYITCEYHLMRTNHKFHSIYEKYNLNSCMSVSTMSVAVSMAKKGLGAIYLPILDIEKEIISKDFEFILSPDNDLFEIYLVINKYKSEEVIINDFINILKESIKSSLSHLINEMY